MADAEERAERPIRAHGPTGRLTQLLLPEEEAGALVQLTLTDRQLCDLELLLNGGFSPLEGFLEQRDYERVVKEMRLADGTLWPMPVCLEVSQALADRLPPGSRAALRDKEGNLLAVLEVRSRFQPDFEAEARAVLGTWDPLHPTVALLQRQVAAGLTWCLGGPIRGVQLPPHYDFVDLRLTPRALARQLARAGWQRVVAFQTRNPMHRSHRELTVQAARDARANVLLHPVVGMTKPGDVDHYTRVRCYQALMAHYPAGMARLALLPLAMRMAGPREAVWHAIIRKNYGADAFIVGRDHAGPGNDSSGKPFYDPYAAQVLLEAHAAELQMQVLKYAQVVYVEDTGEYLQEHLVPQGARSLNISGTELRRRLFRGLPIPEWFTYPEVTRLLREAYPPRHEAGFTVFFTGLSGSGKTTLANALRVALLEDGRRPVSLLLGNEVRTHLSSELGFSREHRDLNVHRVAYVASCITRSRGVAIVSMVAPFAAARAAARELVAGSDGAAGGFVEVHVATPLAVCEARDRRGLYAAARRESRRISPSPSPSPFPRN